jgi:hypothetical protein
LAVEYKKASPCKAMTWCCYFCLNSYKLCKRKIKPQKRKTMSKLNGKKIDVTAYAQSIKLHESFPQRGGVKIKVKPQRIVTIHTLEGVCHVVPFYQIDDQSKNVATVDESTDECLIKPAGGIIEEEGPIDEVFASYVPHLASGLRKRFLLREETLSSN